ncbi:uncharacterized protein [Rhodnius prolixus]
MFESNMLTDIDEDFPHKETSKGDQKSLTSSNLPPVVEDDLEVTNPDVKESVECLDLSRHGNLHKLLGENDYIGDDRTTLNTEFESDTPSIMSVDNMSTSPMVGDRGLNDFDREIMIGDLPLISFYNSHYSEDDRRWARFRVEMFTRDWCVIYCVLGQMLLNEEEMLGSRDLIPTAEEARQILLIMSSGSHWDVLNLCMILNLSEKINRMAKYGNNFSMFKTSTREFMEGSIRTCLDIWERDVMITEI